MRCEIAYGVLRARGTRVARADARSTTTAEVRPKSMAVPNAVKDDSVIHAPRELVASSGLLARTNAVMRTTAATVPANGRDKRASRLDLERTHLATEVAAIPTEVTIAARQTAVAIHPKSVRRSPTGSHPITSGANVHWTPAKQGRFRNSRIAATEAAAGMLTPTKRLTQPIARTFAWVSRLLMRSPSAVEVPEDGRVATVVEGCPAEVGRFHVAPVPQNKAATRRARSGRVSAGHSHAVGKGIDRNLSTNPATPAAPGHQFRDTAGLI
ncbi:hypothetical protein MTE01_14400 [Microbacterium testaceum]|uniref:Uncharacterized protein n=1 Tax=Microbacterium testaceum TaxID=2033 RepID=A0A4Y3QJZ1_MICTE|nr:hypothetical protein MTE01_14400 [Microbacterium testaceum]